MPSVQHPPVDLLEQPERPPLVGIARRYSVAGDPGPAGPMGLKGPRGQTGPRGHGGVTGPKGHNGFASPRVHDGFAGPIGHDKFADPRDHTGFTGALNTNSLGAFNASLASFDVTNMRMCYRDLPTDSDAPPTPSDAPPTTSDAILRGFSTPFSIFPYSACYIPAKDKSIIIPCHAISPREEKECIVMKYN